MKYMYKFTYVHSHIWMLASFVLDNEVVYLNTNKFHSRKSMCQNVLFFYKNIHSLMCLN